MTNLEADIKRIRWILENGGGGGGVSVHNDLTGRSAANAHPMEAIIGLLDALLNKVTVDPLKGLSTNDYTDTDKGIVHGLSAVATSGSYLDLNNLPDIPDGDDYIKLSSSTPQVVESDLVLAEDKQVLFNDGQVDEALIGYHDYGAWKAVEVGAEEKGLTLNTFDRQDGTVNEGILVNYKVQGDPTPRSYILPTGTQFSTLKQVVDSLVLGGIRIGSYTDETVIPQNISGFPSGLLPKVSDFIIVQADGSHGGARTQYYISAIATDTGAITWAYDGAFESTEESILVTDFTGTAVVLSIPSDGTGHQIYWRDTTPAAPDTGPGVGIAARFGDAITFIVKASGTKAYLGTVAITGGTPTWVEILTNQSIIPATQLTGVVKDTASGSVTVAGADLQTTINALGRNIQGSSFTINVTTDAVGPINIYGFIGSGALLINLNGHNISGQTTVRGCAAHSVQFRKGTLENLLVANSYAILWGTSTTGLTQVESYGTLFVQDDDSSNPSVISLLQISSGCTVNVVNSSSITAYGVCGSGRIFSTSTAKLPETASANSSLVVFDLISTNGYSRNSYVKVIRNYTIHWDNINGLDTNDGLNEAHPVKTWAACINLMKGMIGSPTIHVVTSPTTYGTILIGDVNTPIPNGNIKFNIDPGVTFTEWSVMSSICIYVLGSSSVLNINGRFKLGGYCNVVGAGLVADRMIIDTSGYLVTVCPFTTNHTIDTGGDEIRGIASIQRDWTIENAGLYIPPGGSIFGLSTLTDLYTIKVATTLTVQGRLHLGNVALEVGGNVNVQGGQWNLSTARTVKITGDVYARYGGMILFDTAGSTTDASKITAKSWTAENGSIISTYSQKYTPSYMLPSGVNASCNGTFQNGQAFAAGSWGQRYMASISSQNVAGFYEVVSTPNQGIKVKKTGYYIVSFIPDVYNSGTASYGIGASSATNPAISSPNQGTLYNQNNGGGGTFTTIVTTVADTVISFWMLYSAARTTGGVGHFYITRVSD